jgi:hypothetical protein
MQGCHSDSSSAQKARYRTFQYVVDKSCYYKPRKAGYWLRVVKGARCVRSKQYINFLARVRRQALTMKTKGP